MTGEIPAGSCNENQAGYGRSGWLRTSPSTAVMVTKTVFYPTSLDPYIF